MLLPVDLMSIVGAATPSANAPGSEGGPDRKTGSWLLTADANASSMPDKDMINKIFMSYAESQDADSAAQFAADLKALLSANGVSFTSDQALGAPMLELSALPNDGQPVELAWSVDELLQLAVEPLAGGNSLPPGDQTLPAELSQWLTALMAPAQGDAASSSGAAVSASGHPSVVLTGAGEPGQHAAASQILTAALEARSQSGGTVSAAVSASAPASAAAGVADSVSGALVTAPATGAVGPDGAGITPVAGATVFGGTAEGSPVSQSLTPMTGDKVNAAAGQQGGQELTLVSQAQSETVRQATQAAQINPDGQTVARDAANASAFRAASPEQSGNGEGMRFTDDRLPNQASAVNTSMGSLERSPAGTAQLTAGLAAAANADSATSAAQAQLPHNDDGSTVNPRVDQRMFATEHAQQAQSQASQQVVARTADGLPRFVMDTAFGQQGWPDSLGRQLMVMSSQGVSSAQIQLDPPELGSLMVKIQVSADQQTSVSFVSQHALVRETLEQQLNRLQDLFREQGLNLQDVSVSDQSPQQREGDSGQHQGQRQGSGSGDQEQASGEQILVRSESLIDYYA